jgi:trehalose synthase
MSRTETGDLWWKTAVIYCLDVKTFLDWNDDGIGDFEGLGERIDYLAELGITCLWLMPFYPAGGTDDGYDVVDYFGVDPKLGTLGDFVEIVRTARDRGIRVIVDLVVQHTSDRHPWFQAALTGRDSPFRDYYIWRSRPPANASKQVAFPGAEDSVWELDRKSGEYFRHQFYKHQPDLNITNPRVREEIAKVLSFWLELGVAGFRVDAVPYLVTGAHRRTPKETAELHEYLRSFHALLGRRGDAILLGEADVAHDEQFAFFGGDDAHELTMQFDFVAMQALYLSLARQDAHPLARALESRSPIRDYSQWANFVRNHDELTLDKLTEKQREEVFTAFGPDKRMQAFGRGLIRRLPPMLQGDPAHIKLVYSLLLTLPGTPVLYYGEEIGMGENLSAGGRAAVRTPMQWSAEQPNAGFSAAKRIIADVATGEYGPENVNVNDQRFSGDSLLSFFQNLLAIRRQSPEIGWSAVNIIAQADTAVLAHLSRWEHREMVSLHNLSAAIRTVTLELEATQRDCILLDLLRGDRIVVDGRTLTVELEPYGYRWLRVLRPDRPTYPITGGTAITRRSSAVGLTAENESVDIPRQTIAFDRNGPRSDHRGTDGRDRADHIDRDLRKRSTSLRNTVTNATVVLDAFALGVLRKVRDVAKAFAGRLVPTPNVSEAERLAGHGIDNLPRDLRGLAAAFEAVISCQNLIAAPDGALRSAGSGTVGLATSGSGDVLAGAIAGLAARGATPEQAAVWGTYLHATAGDLQATRLGPVGFLARDLLMELPVILDRLRPQ